MLYPQSESGYALVYAKKYENKKTASGEIYKSNLLTAAHPYLPFGTMVEVINLKNNKKVEVKINDRLLPKGGVIIHLSEKAAELLDIKGKEKVKIIVKKIPEGKENFIQRGYASWYGGKFQGRKTACGIIFDTYKYYAAHKTLPCGTIVRVKNLENNKSVEVKIVDRGPFKKNRIIDLSYKSAKEIGIIKDGVGLVEIEVVKWPY
ncbi:MAG: septal ring lytic transglycosylase RlpA family protein [candidate division WOR-3 bacterium]